MAHYGMVVFSKRRISFIDVNGCTSLILAFERRVALNNSYWHAKIKKNMRGKIVVCRFQEKIFFRKSERDANHLRTKTI